MLVTIARALTQLAPVWAPRNPTRRTWILKEAPFALQVPTARLLRQISLSALVASMRREKAQMHARSVLKGTTAMAIPQPPLPASLTTHRFAWERKPR